MIELARSLAVPDADSGGTHPTDEFAPAGALPRFDDVRSCAYLNLELLDQAAERFNSRDVGPYF